MNTATQVEALEAARALFKATVLPDLLKHGREIGRSGLDGNVESAWIMHYYAVLRWQFEPLTLVCLMNHLREWHRLRDEAITQGKPEVPPFPCLPERKCVVPPPGDPPPECPLVDYKEEDTGCPCVVVWLLLFLAGLGALLVLNRCGVLK
jgi:hypothetical protein